MALDAKGQLIDVLHINLLYHFEGIVKASLPVFAHEHPSYPSLTNHLSNHEVFNLRIGQLRLYSTLSGFDL